MPFHSFSLIYSLNYFLKREANQFFSSIAIRSLALGMILIFEPIYLYFYFGHSLSLTVLFFAASHGLYALLAVFGGRLASKIGLKHSILLSHLLFLGYYFALFLINSSFLLVPLAIILKAIGMTFFWPAFHIDFNRFSETNYRGREVGKMNVAFFIPTIISPLIGGWILTVFNYPVLFTVVLITLLTSAIPLFLSREVHETYSDSYFRAWQRIFKKTNKRTSLAFAADSAEIATNLYLWPLFMAVLAIKYNEMGGIVSFSLAVAALFTLYMGRISDRLINRVQFLNIGSFLTAMAWVIKYFVKTPFDAFLAHTIYRICRTSASIPFQAFLYERASLKGKEADEFIVYREIIVNLTRFVFLAAMAGVFFLIPKVNIAFLAAAFFSLGFMLLGVPPKLGIKNFLNINNPWRKKT